MTTPENKRTDRGRDEVLAGEYVLGVLPAAERLKVEQRIREDKAFARIVSRWEANLSGFNNEYTAGEPPPAWVFKSVESRLFGRSDAYGRPVRALWGSLLFWRGLSLVSLAAALLFVANAAGLLGKPEDSGRLVATLAAPQSSISLVTLFDQDSGRLRITPVAAGAKDEKSLELWLIEGNKPPEPLGVLPDKGGEIIVPPAMRARMTEGVTIAVSLEPRGGSPTGLPTGPVLVTGKIGTI